jgi:hypothetical protein
MASLVSLTPRKPINSHFSNVPKLSRKRRVRSLRGWRNLISKNAGLATFLWFLVEMRLVAGARYRRCRRSRRPSAGKSRFGLGGRGGGGDAHDSSVQHPRIAFASRKPPARRAGLIAAGHRYSVCPAEGGFAPPSLFHPWKRDKSPAFHASRSPGVLRSQSGRISLVTVRRSCQRSATDGRPQNQ